MASTFASYFGLRSTVVFTTAGTQAPVGTMYAVSSNGGPVWTNTLTVSSFSTLLGSSITVSSLRCPSTTISLGASTNQSNNLSNGSFTTGWGSTLNTYNTLSTVTEVVMSQSGQYQYAIQSAQSSMSTYQVAKSSDSGITWQTLNNTGLPVTTYAYQSTVSGYPNYSNLSVSANGQYALAAVNGGQLYVSNNANSTTPVFTPANVGGSPYVYLPFENSVTDSMGNSTVTATGSPVFITGKVGSNAINLANTAGGTATKYVRGTWTGSSNFTVSFWLNAQSIGVQQTVFSAYSAGYQIYINSSNQIVLYIPNGGAAASVNAITGPTISSNTWYNVVAIFQTSGICSLYVNNSLSGTYTNSGGVGTLTTTAFGLGTYDNLLTYAFNGYIDDLRIYHIAAQNAVSPYIYLPMEGAVTDVMGNSTITATGSPGYAAGVVGTQAVSFVNPAGGVPVQYLSGTWTIPSNFSISLWVNIQSLGTNSSYIFVLNSADVTIQTNTSGQLLFYAPNASPQNINSTFYVTPNTWYYIVVIYQTNGTCSFYVNNVLVGQSTASGALTANTTYSIGCNTANMVNYALNGYVDDVRLYNYALTSVNPIVPMNWSQTAVSSTGQYMLAAAAGGGLFQSSNYGASWTQLTTTQIASLIGPGQAAVTVNGPITTPNQTGLTASGTALTTSRWSINGVSWIAVTSSVYNSSYALSNLFNNTPSNGWAGALSTTSSGNTSNVFTVIQNGIGSTQGEWIELQTSAPLIMTSYQFATNVTPNQLPKTYYIVGSNDRVTWYAIQYGSAAAAPSSTANTLIASTIIVNRAGGQTFGSTTLTTTIYSTTTNAYSYFRLIMTSIYSGGVAEIGEWYPSFYMTMPLLVSPSPPNTQLRTVTPNLTGLSVPNWTTANGVTWKSSESSLYSAGYETYRALDGIYGNRWVPYYSYSTTGNTAVSTTTIQGGVGTQTGDWMQLQSSVPLVMTSYQFANGFTSGPSRICKTFYIIGSNDGTTWYPIQYGSIAASPLNTGYALITNTIIVNSAGAQTFGSSTLTTTTYSTTTDAYTYFRLVCLTSFSGGDNIDIGEWLPYFTAATPNPMNSLAISSTNMIATATSTTAPNSTMASSNSWTANGVNWISSASSFYNGSTLAYCAFNPPLAPIAWAGAASAYSSSSPYAYTANTYSTTILGGIGTIAGDWLQLQSSVPLIMNSYTWQASGIAQQPKNYYIVGSNDGTNWYPIQYAVGNTTPFTAGSQACITYLTVNSSSTQSIQGGQTGSYTTTAYSTSANSYTYFRLVVTHNWGYANGNTNVGQWFINFQLGATYSSTNNGSSWTTTLTTPTNAPVLATAGSYVLTATNQTVYLYSNGITGTYTNPTLTGINANIYAAAMSTTGQYMVLVTQGTSNHVFYSINYGVTWTALTIGSAAMTSCAMSADGFFVTVSNATAVYTLNRNATGYSIAIGNQAGAINQGLNTIAIGNQAGVTNQGQNTIAIGNLAGVTNQAPNSIILNANGTTLDTTSTGFYVAPVSNYTASSATLFNIIGYGSDSQMVQTGIKALANGNVGIGTTNPAWPLHVIGNINLTGSILYNGTAIATGSGSIWTAGSGGTVYYNGGNVGIGTNVVSNTLELFNSTSNPFIRFQGMGGSGAQVGIIFNTFAGRPPCAQIIAIDDGAFSAPLVFSTAPSGSSGGAAGANTAVERMRITQSGNVGIGTTNPSVPLHVNGMTFIQGPTMSTNTANNVGNFGLRISQLTSQQSTVGQIVGQLCFHGNGRPYASSFVRSITDSNSWDDASALVFGVSNGGNGAAEAMRISSNTNVGIGTTTPSAALHIYNATAAYTNSLIVNTSWPSIRLGSSSVTGRDWIILNGGTGAGIGQGNFGIFDLTANTYRLSIDLYGNVGIGNLTSVPSRLYVDAVTDVSTGICQINAGANNANSKAFLTGKSNAALMPSFWSNIVYFYGTSGTTPYTYQITASTYFTGQHANQPIDPVLKTNIQDYVGLIVSSADQGYYTINPATNVISTGIDAITITEALPYIELTTTDQDPAVWGVLTNVKNDTYDTDGTTPLDNTNEWGDRLGTMVRVNGLGEGAVWVTNINGNIRNGDWICSSAIPGYGRKQNDDLFHNYTVAKATMSCQFDLSTTKYKCKTITHNGTEYIAAFIGCTYHCS